MGFKSDYRITQSNDGYSIHHIIGTNEWEVCYYGQPEKLCSTKREAQEYISRCTGR